MSQIWVFLMWYAVCAVATIVMATICMMREGEIRLKDVVATFFLAGVFWPFGLCMLLMYYADKINWERTVWESEEHKRTKARIYTERSEEE
jgi:hypothetical protein